jgi:bifunctional aspartokinase / homoserine dehydrogenase 1
MKILKFGGTSVGSPDNINTVVSIIQNSYQPEEPLGIVVSAFGGITNQLIEAGQLAARSDEEYQQIFTKIENRHLEAIRALIKVQRQSNVIAKVKLMLNELDDLLHGIYLLKELSPRTTDLLLSFGERLSAYIINERMLETGVPSAYIDTRDYIETDNNFGKARVNFEITNRSLQKLFAQTPAIKIITGFIASTKDKVTTTLGRGGSDYTAAIIAAALQADEIEIWTDVDGVMTADPRMVKAAFSLQSISYNEAMEMSHFGAKVIYPPTLQPAFGNEISIRIRNTFNPAFAGTLISRDSINIQFPVKGISSIKEITLINVIGSGMVGVPGVASRLFGTLAKYDINVILITQASSEHSICFAVDPHQSAHAKDVLENEFTLELQSRRIDSILLEENLSIIAIIGENMRKSTGISGRMLNALGKNGVNVIAIAQGSSELNISVVINKADLSKSVNLLHEAFFLSDIKSLNIYLVGLGLIGSTLLRQIEKQQDYLYHHHHLKLNLVGITNSRKMLISDEEIPFQKWNENLQEKGNQANLQEFCQSIIAMNLLNSVFVDCTASNNVVAHYENLLRHNVSIVTPSKLANSGSYEFYKKLFDLTFRRGVKFLYETNVGAGLPVITTLNDLKHSGDRVIKIEGVLSGTLSYIFNNFKEGQQFSQVVKEAKEKGFTEPDPRDDLNGMDVSRKILILAREVGLTLEPEDVATENILPQTCLNAETVEAFFQELEAHNHIFEELRQQAEANNQALRFIATLEEGKARVGLEAVGADHPFYHLSGSDNVISFTTARYKERPLVIKGPGAGAEVTAAGVFAEIISISNYLSIA